MEAADWLSLGRHVHGGSLASQGRQDELVKQTEMHVGRQARRAGKDWRDCRHVPPVCLGTAHADGRRQWGDSGQSEPPLYDEADLEAFGHCVVDHKAHIRLVNPHACTQGKQQLSSQGTGHKPGGAAQLCAGCRGSTLPPARPVRLHRPCCTAPALLAELLLKHLERMPDAHLTGTA